MSESGEVKTVVVEGVSSDSRLLAVEVPRTGFWDICITLTLLGTTGEPVIIDVMVDDEWRCSATLETPTDTAKVRGKMGLRGHCRLWFRCPKGSGYKVVGVKGGLRHSRQVTM